MKGWNDDAQAPLLGFLIALPMVLLPVLTVTTEVRSRAQEPDALVESEGLELAAAQIWDRLSRPGLGTYTTPPCSSSGVYSEDAEGRINTAAYLQFGLGRDPG